MNEKREMPENDNQTVNCQKQSIGDEQLEQAQFDALIEREKQLFGFAVYSEDAYGSKRVVPHEELYDALKKIPVNYSK